MQINKSALLILLGFTGFTAFSQETATDTIKTTNLEEVVVTGQFEPQSIKKSVHNVRVISRQDIDRQGGNNLADVLNQYLNITVRPSSNDGRSTVSMFGLDGQYFKILVDNIPLVGDTGLGNNIDLTQINLDDIEQVEIIEGSMGVTHGANAVTGILNIITKKSARTKWEIDATVQEETVGSEYGLFDKGRHIQALKVSHNITENWFASVGANRNDFAGYFDDRLGRAYRENDGSRGYAWLPKQQLVANALIGYRKNDFRLFYKFDYLTENIDFDNPIVIPVDNYPFESTYYSQDKRFKTNRFYHHLNSYGHLFSTRVIYNVSVSHQKQARDEERFNYYIIEQEERNLNRATYQSKEVLYSTGTFTNFFDSKKFDLQLGYEIVNENGFSSASSGTFKNDDQQAEDVRARLKNYDFYASAEASVTEKFSIRPGFRYSFQSKFEDQNALSLGFRYLFDKRIEARASVGKSYRTPNFDELYTYFVDSNHNLQGNEDLVPEQSMSFELSLKKTTLFDSGLQMINNISTSFINIDDRISMVLAGTDPILRYQYLNIDSYRIWNLASAHQMAYRNIEAKLGASLVGVSQQIDTAASDAVSDDKFLYSFQLNSNIAYNVPAWNTLFSIYYKYTGPFQQFVQTTNSGGDAIFVLSELEGYGMMDGSVRKSFFNNKFDVTLGARNLLNVKSIQSTQAGGGSSVHDAASSTLMLGYGRSYFIKLTYNLNFN